MTEAIETLAQRVVAAVGGAANVTAVTRCWSRLRLTVLDPAKADDDAIASQPEIAMVLWQSGQLQIVPRSDLLALHDAVARLVTPASPEGATGWAAPLV